MILSDFTSSDEIATKNIQWRMNAVKCQSAPKYHPLFQYSSF